MNISIGLDSSVFILVELTVLVSRKVDRLMFTGSKIGGYTLGSINKNDNYLIVYRLGNIIDSVATGGHVRRYTASIAKLFRQIRLPFLSIWTN